MQEPDPLNKIENDAERTQRVVRAIQPITNKAQRIVGKVKGMAWVYLAGAFLMEGLLFVPFSSSSSWMYAFAAAVLLLFSMPSIILYLFYRALQSVIALPARLLDKAGIGEAAAREMLQTVGSGSGEGIRKKRGKILRTLFELNKLVLDGRDMLFEYTALLRLANPFVLGIVGIATVSGFGLVAIALISVILKVF